MSPIELLKNWPIPLPSLDALVPNKTFPIYIYAQYIYI